MPMYGQAVPLVRAFYQLHAAWNKQKDAEQKPATSNINQPDRGTTAHSSKKTSLITTSIAIMLIQYK